MNILVVGGLGRMGSRYCSILRSLDHTPVIFDKGDDYSDEKYQTPIDHAIVATPTETHWDALHELLAITEGMDVLCEKPILKTPGLLYSLYRDFERRGSNLYCVNQYAHHAESRMFEMADSSETTSYDYYHSGNDGLHWDCFQLYALAKGPVSLKNSSPIWKCTINGWRLSPGLMDRAYVDMIKDFVGPKSKMWGHDIVVKTTERISASL